MYIACVLHRSIIDNQLYVPKIDVSNGWEFRTYPMSRAFAQRWSRLRVKWYMANCASRIPGMAHEDVLTLGDTSKMGDCLAIWWKENSTSILKTWTDPKSKYSHSNLPQDNLPGLETRKRCTCYPHLNGDKVNLRTLRILFQWNINLGLFHMSWMPLMDVLAWRSLPGCYSILPTPEATEREFFFCHLTNMNISPVSAMEYLSLSLLLKGLLNNLI